MLSPSSLLPLESSAAVALDFAFGDARGGGGGTERERREGEAGRALAILTPFERAPGCCGGRGRGGGGGGLGDEDEDEDEDDEEDEDDGIGEKDALLSCRMRSRSEKGLDGAMRLGLRLRGDDGTAAVEPLPEPTLLALAVLRRERSVRGAESDLRFRGDDGRGGGAPKDEDEEDEEGEEGGRMVPWLAKRRSPFDSLVAVVALF